jgi:hypothetical protein
MPLLSSKEEYLKTDYENWQIYTWTEGNNLTGDFPIILDKFVDFSSLNEELIFPLAKNKILVHTKRTKPLKLALEFKIHLDMLILQQATRYVCCADKAYLELLQKELYSYSKNYDFKSRMKDKLFGYFA